MLLSDSELVRLYGKWIKDYLDTGTWEGYLITIMFKHLTRLLDPIDQMHQEIIRLYSKIVISVVRNPLLTLIDILYAIGGRWWNSLTIL